MIRVITAVAYGIVCVALIIGARREPIRSSVPVYVHGAVVSAIGAVTFGVAAVVDPGTSEGWALSFNVLHWAVLSNLALAAAWRKWNRG